jgi:hypothetical protein
VRHLYPLEAATRHAIVQHLHPTVRQGVSKSLQFPPRSVGRLMDGRFDAFRPRVRVGEALATVAARPRALATCFVIDEQTRPIGVITLAELVACQVAMQLIDVMRPCAPPVSASAPLASLEDAVLAEGDDHLAVIGPLWLLACSYAASLCAATIARRRHWSILRLSRRKQLLGHPTKSPRRSPTFRPPATKNPTIRLPQKTTSTIHRSRAWAESRIRSGNAANVVYPQAISSTARGEHVATTCFDMEIGKPEVVSGQEPRKLLAIVACWTARRLGTNGIWRGRSGSGRDADRPSERVALFAGRVS